MAQLEEFVRDRMNFPNNDDEAFVICFELSPQTADKSEQFFRFFISTKRLLQNASGTKTLNADGTHKITDEELLLIVVGCTDVRGKFHLIGIGVTNKETSEAYAMCFNAIRFGIKESQESN